METRHRLRLPLRCPVIFASDEFIGEGTVVDLGVPGCAVESRVTPSPGEYVRRQGSASGGIGKGTLGQAAAVRR